MCAIFGELHVCVFKKGYQLNRHSDGGRGVIRCVLCAYASDKQKGILYLNLTGVDDEIHKTRQMNYLTLAHSCLYRHHKFYLKKYFWHFCYSDFHPLWTFDGFSFAYRLYTHIYIYFQPKRIFRKTKCILNGFQFQGLYLRNQTTVIWV